MINYSLQQLQQIHQVLVTAPLPLQMSLPLAQLTEAMIAERQRPPAPPAVAPAPPVEPPPAASPVPNPLLGGITAE